jgi:hypothetical protein
LILDYPPPILDLAQHASFPFSVVRACTEYVLRCELVNTPSCRRMPPCWVDLRAFEAIWGQFGPRPVCEAPNFKIVITRWLQPSRNLLVLTRRSQVRQKAGPSRAELYPASTLHSCRSRQVPAALVRRPDSPARDDKPGRDLPVPCLNHASPEQYVSRADRFRSKSFLFKSIHIGHCGSITCGRNLGKLLISKHTKRQMWR